MRRCAAPATVVALCLALASCAAGSGRGRGVTAAAASGNRDHHAQAEATTAVVGPGRASCPATRPPRPPFVPPKPYRATPPPLYGGVVWYGSEELWTWLRPDGTWPMARDEDGLFDKSFWWRAGYDPRREPTPELTLTARRLDTPGSSIAASGGEATNGSRPADDIGSFMLTGIELPATGCWEITGHYGDSSLAFVVWVT